MTGYRIVVESDEHRHYICAVTNDDFLTKLASSFTDLPQPKKAYVSSRDDAAHWVWVDTVAWLYTQAVAESVLRQQVSSLIAQLHEARLALGIAS
ncbi:hypothetical protein [Mycobacterium canetti]|uniref:hypothetical protein n=1 Tax=Mycobacterium canetti TaxID=78331 RepID=UPI000346F287|nr:hypothetical protein [Mycobacterium canetti]